MPEDLTPAPIAENEPVASLGERQIAVGEGWAKLYGDPTIAPPTNAELALRNPTAYIDGINPHQLPEELQGRWDKLLRFCDDLAAFGDTETTRWAPSTHLLEKIQTLMYGGRISPAFRGSASDVIRQASQLFSDSIVHIPGNSAAYESNVASAETYLEKATQQ